ncbi:MAG TPA: extracellular solute-binding protein [Ktedonobacteraceae bacterium]|nr:extracellular solute-binding protein [Ktedonobacteraceae bacterium]
MRMSSYSRRQFCKFGLSSIAASMAAQGLLAGCGSAGSAHQLQLYFWGPASRNTSTKKAIQSFQATNADISIRSSFSDWGTYWDKLNTQIAGGTIPDLIQMDITYIAQYAKQNIIQDLTSFTSNKTIDLSSLDPTLVENSKYNGTLYSIPLGGTCAGLVYDTDLARQSGVGLPPATMTYSEFASYTRELTNALKKKGVYGTIDASGQMMNFEVWVRQRGKNFYTSDGKLSIGVDDIAEWFDYWNGLRASGACVPAQTQASVAGASGPDTSLLIQGKAVFDVSWSNQFPGYQGLTQHTLALYMPPTGQQPGLYVKPGQLMSISTKSKDSQDAATFINFLVNNAKGIQAIGLDRGVPGNTKTMATLSSSLDSAQKETLSYTTQVEKSNQVRPLTILPPAGSGAIGIALLKVAQSVSFGQLSASAGAQSFYDQAIKALA